MKKRLFSLVKIIVLVVSIFVCSYKGTDIKTNAESNNTYNYVDLSMMAKKIDEFDYANLYTPLATYSGDLTGYIYNCPMCSGRLACDSKYYLGDGRVTYPDQTYGDVNIVASSANLPCGTIITFQNDRVSSEKVVAIVLDRGVRGTALDLLTTSYEAATTLGRTYVTYDILRNGW